MPIHSVSHVIGCLALIRLWTSTSPKNCHNIFSKELPATTATTSPPHHGIVTGRHVAFEKVVLFSEVPEVAGGYLASDLSATRKQKSKVCHAVPPVKLNFQEIYRCIYFFIYLFISCFLYLGVRLGKNPMQVRELIRMKRFRCSWELPGCYGQRASAGTPGVRTSKGRTSKREYLDQLANRMDLPMTYRQSGWFLNIKSDHGKNGRSYTSLHRYI